MLKRVLSPVTGIVFAGIVLIAGFVITGNPSEHPPTLGETDVRPAGTFRTTELVVEDTAKIGGATGTEKLSVLSDQGGTDDIGLYKYNATQTGVKQNYYRARGTFAAPTTVVTTDQTYFQQSFGYDGAGFFAATEIVGSVVGTVAAGVVPGQIDIWTADAAGALRDNFRFDSSHHFSVLDVTAPALTSCGTSPSIVGSDQAGTVTIGTAATGCTITFHTTWAAGAAVHCTLLDRSGHLFSNVISSTAITLTSIGPLSSDLIDYTCIAGGTP